MLKKIYIAHILFNAHSNPQVCYKHIMIESVQFFHTSVTGDLHTHYVLYGSKALFFNFFTLLRLTLVVMTVNSLLPDVQETKVFSMRTAFSYTDVQKCQGISHT